MEDKNGFTVVELIVITVILVAAVSLFLLQRADLASSERDNRRKTSINAMYYALEEAYYPTNKSYPAKLDKKVLPSIDPALLNDPAGNAIGKSNSTLRYEPNDCRNEKCQGYTLRADLEKEADFVKESRN